jgi:flagellar hook assembly protein FlgD
MSIYNAAGQLVRDLGVGRGVPIYWDGRDASGQRVAPGVYFVRVETATGAKHSKLILAR